MWFLSQHRLASKSPHVYQTSSDWFHCCDITHRGRSLLKIFVYAAKQACKQLQCNKAKLLEPVPINGLQNQKGLG